jgi:hypothetical protein
MTTILLLSSLAGAASLDVYPGDDIVTLTESLTAGSEVVFHAGTYTLESSLYWTGEGTAQAPIVLRAADGEAPVIEIADGSYLARVEAASWVTIQGLSFQGAAGWEESSLGGLQILGSNNVTLSDCEISQVVSTGIYVAYDSSNISITGNHIHDVASSTAVYVGHSDASYFVLDSEISYNWIHDIGDEYDYAIYLAAGTQGATVQHNVIYNINTYGVRLDSTELGDRNTLEGNVIWNVRDMGIDAAGPALVRNNLVFNVDGYGIYARNNGYDTLADLVISFNTVANTGDWGVVLNDWAGREGMVFANNAVSNPIGWGVYGDDEHTDEGNYISGNVVTGLVEGFADRAGAIVAGGGFDDFSDAENWDFYPVSGSHLVNTADPSSEAWVPQVDFNGAPREGDTPDVGAYEYDGASNPGWAIREGFKDLSLEAGSGDQVTGGGCCGKNDEAAEAGLFLLPGLLFGAGLRRRRRRGERREGR